VQPGEADTDLSSMLDVLLVLLQELAAATRPGSRSPTQYGRYKAALQCLQTLGPRFVAARLLTKQVGQEPHLLSAWQQQQQVVAGVLLERLLEVTANSVNKDMRNAAEAAMATTAALVSTQVLRRETPWRCEQASAWQGSSLGMLSLHLLANN
jgi:hypothetical protein